MVSLLDVNVLIALSDSVHRHHGVISDWFLAEKARAWATCPITENGIIRILSSKSYDYPQSIEIVRKILNRMKAAPGHQFWPDSISICDTKRIACLHNSKATTDLYLLAPALKNKGQFVTLDQKIKVDSVRSGAAACLLLSDI
jgi:toxin-antitoxin system PIN domain toxin